MRIRGPKAYCMDLSSCTKTGYMRRALRCLQRGNTWQGSLR